MGERHSFRVVVLGRVAVFYPQAQGKQLTSAKRSLLAALVAGDGAGVDPTDLLPLSGGTPVEPPALRMAISRLRADVPDGALPTASDARYYLRVAEDDVDVWRLRALATGADLMDCSVADLFHLLRPVAPFDGAAATALTERAAQQIARHQRDLLKRVGRERPDLLEGEFVGLVDEHLRTDPHNEQLLLWMAGTLAQSGDRKGALDRIAEARQEMIGLGLDLNQEIAALEQDLLSGQVQVVALTPKSREALPPRLESVRIDSYVDGSARLEAMLDAVWASGYGGGVFSVSGRSGSGKTRFCAELAVAMQRSHRIAYVEPRGSDSAVAYGALAAGVPGFQERIDSATSALGDTELLRAALWSAGVESVRTLTSEPALLLIDDTQGLDEYSLDLLAHVASSAPQRGLTLVLSGRDIGHERTHSELVGRVSLVGDVERIEVAPLTVAELRRLIAERNPRLDERRLRHLSQELEVATGGLAGVAALVAASLDTDGLGARETLASTGESLLVRALANLSPTAREVGVVASLAGPAFDLRVLRVMTERNDDELLAATDELIGKDLVEEVAVGQYRVVHVLVEAAFLKTEQATILARLHYKLAGYYREDVHRSAFHESQAFPWVPKEQTARRLIESGDLQLEAGLVGKAAETYRQATILDPDVSVSIARNHSRALDLSGAERSAARVRQMAFEVLLDSGAYDDAFAVATSGLPEGESIDGSLELVEMLLRLESCRGHSQNFDLAATLARQLTIVGRLDDAADRASVAGELADTGNEHVKAAVAARFVRSSTAEPLARYRVLESASGHLARAETDVRSDYLVLAAIDQYEAGSLQEATSLISRLDLEERLHPTRTWHSMLYGAMVAADTGQSQEALVLRRAAYEFGLSAGIGEAVKALLAADFVDLWLSGTLESSFEQLGATPLAHDQSVLSRAGWALALAANGDGESASHVAQQVFETVERSQVTQGVAALGLICELLAGCAPPAVLDRADQILARRGRSNLIIGAFAASLGPIERYRAHLHADQDSKLELLRSSVLVADQSGLDRWKVITRQSLAPFDAAMATELQKLEIGAS